MIVYFFGFTLVLLLIFVAINLAILNNYKKSTEATNLFIKNLLENLYADNNKVNMSINDIAEGFKYLNSSIKKLDDGLDLELQNLTDVASLSKLIDDNNKLLDSNNELINNGLDNLLTLGQKNYSALKLKFEILENNILDIKDDNDDLNNYKSSILRAIKDENYNLDNISDTKINKLNINDSNYNSRRNTRKFKAYRGI